VLAPHYQIELTLPEEASTKLTVLVERTAERRECAMGEAAGAKASRT
jgi:hypothetical protein